MYIVSQDGCNITNSNRVARFYVFPCDPKETAFIAADYDGGDTRSTYLGGYITFQKAHEAHEVFQMLLSALQDGTEIFHMPHP